MAEEQKEKAAEGETKKAKKDRRIPGTRRTIMFMLARFIALVVFHTICPVKYHGRERLPGSAPYILISNHFSNWDPLINGYPISQDVTYLGKKELTANPVLSWLFDHLHMIPIDRHNTDMAAVRNCMKALKDGEILGIYPEGTRHHEGIMEQTEDGIALIALRAGVPVIPMLIATKIRAFHVTHVYIGEDIPTKDLKEKGINRESCAAFMERMHDVYREMIRQHEEGKR